MGFKYLKNPLPPHNKSLNQTVSCPVWSGFPPPTSWETFPIWSGRLSKSGDDLLSSNKLKEASLQVMDDSVMRHELSLRCPLPPS